MVDVNSAIFHDIVESSRLGQDRELMALLHHQSSRESPLYNEVQTLIGGLNLREFDSFSIPKHDDGLQNGTGSAKKQTPANYAEDLKVSLQEVPKLTKTQRRMSFDLMQMHNGTQRSPQVSLSKPPEAAVSNVNIVTKVTDLETRGYTPVQLERRNSLKDKFSSYQNRFKLVNRRKDMSLTKNVPNIENPGISTIPEETGSLKGRINGSLKGSNVAGSIEEPTALIADSPRRISLVGENLPVYIKEQLRQGREVAETGTTQENSAVKSPSSSHHLTDDAALGSTVPSTPRVVGALAISESVPLRTNDSEITDNSFGHANNESTISDADKEYILPSLFNRFLDYGENDALESESNGSLSEEEEDDEDEYLFNSQVV